MARTALITGVTGQDGAYLADYLLKKKYRVYGMYRRTSTPNFWRLLSLGIRDRIIFIPGDITDMASIANAVIQSQPDEIYNLAAQSFVGTSFEQPLVTAHVDGLGPVMLLEAVKQINAKIRVLHASTSELFGACERHRDGKQVRHNEKSLFWPVSPYAASKLFAFHQIRIYREAYGMFAVNAISFNHESPLRGLEFVTRKISNSVARIALGLQDRILLGNLSARRDWGYAPEYVEAMWMMLQQKDPQDIVLATGETHSVREFAELACKLTGLDWRERVQRDEKLERPLDVNCLRGDASLARTELGWVPRRRFKDIVSIMVQADTNRWRDWLNGKIFAWDAPNDPSMPQAARAVAKCLQSGPRG